MALNASAETRAQIMDAAKTLLRRHGNDRLTVMDIARSLDMSHANVYRYFRNKSEILDAIIDEWMAKIELFVESIAGRPLPAAERLEAVVLELHRKRKQKLLEDSEVFETYRRVIELRPEAAARRREQIVRVFTRLIEEGVKSGEFAEVDSTEAAAVLKDATSLFLHPFLIPTILNEDTDQRARNVVRCVLAGFSKAVLRNTSPPAGHIRPSANQAPPSTSRQRRGSSSRRTGLRKE